MSSLRKMFDTGLALSMGAVGDSNDIGRRNTLLKIAAEVGVSADSANRIVRFYPRPEEALSAAELFPRLMDGLVFVRENVASEIESLYGARAKAVFIFGAELTQIVFVLGVLTKVDSAANVPIEVGGVVATARSAIEISIGALGGPEFLQPFLDRCCEAAQSPNLGSIWPRIISELSGDIAPKVGAWLDVHFPEKLVAPVSQAPGRKIFLVHGHDTDALNLVARSLQKLGCDIIILGEQPNEGKTIIEKFEAHATQAGFAIVLLTGDDVGAAASAQTTLRPRARQNVILELGYFLGKVGRKSVCALYKGDVELPSDYHGVLWIPLRDGWELAVARELRAAGIPIDLNRVV